MLYLAMVVNKQTGRVRALNRPKNGSESETVQEKGSWDKLCSGHSIAGLIAQPRVWRGKAAAGILENKRSRMK
jgi:hypothetical protein